jgi:hypothetical protein
MGRVNGAMYEVEGCEGLGCHAGETPMERRRCQRPAADAEVMVDLPIEVKAAEI